MATGLLVYAHGAFLFMSFMPTGPVFYAYGLSLLYLGALAQIVKLLILAILTVSFHDMLSCSILNIACHLDHQNRLSFNNPQGMFS